MVKQFLSKKKVQIQNTKICKKSFQTINKTVILRYFSH